LAVVGGGKAPPCAISYLLSVLLLACVFPKFKALLGRSQIFAEAPQSADAVRGNPPNGDSKLQTQTGALEVF